MEPGQDEEGVGHSSTLMLEPKVGEEGTQVGQSRVSEHKSWVRRASSWRKQWRWDVGAQVG